jgi:hypothetical protein
VPRSAALPSAERAGFGRVSTTIKTSPLLPSSAQELTALIGDAWGPNEEPSVTYDDDGSVRWVYGYSCGPDGDREHGVTFRFVGDEWLYRFDDGEEDTVSTEAELVRDVLVRPNSEGLPDPDPIVIAGLLDAARAAGDEVGAVLFGQALNGRAAAMILAAKRIKVRDRLEREASE